MQITKEEVKQILEKVKACVHNDKFRISLNPNRIENQSFINDYRLTTKQQKRMILELDIYDFSKIDIDRKNKINSSNVINFSSLIVIFSDYRKYL